MPKSMEQRIEQVRRLFGGELVVYRRRRRGQTERVRVPTELVVDAFLRAMGGEPTGFDDRLNRFLATVPDADLSARPDVEVLPVLVARELMERAPRSGRPDGWVEDASGGEPS